MTILSVAYPVGDLVLLFGIATILLRRHVSYGRLPVTLLMIGLAATFSADFIFGYQNLNGTYITGNWVDALWTIGALPLVLGAHCRWLIAEREVEQPSVPKQLRSGLIGLPYFAVVCAFAILILIEFDEGSSVRGLNVLIAA